MPLPAVRPRPRRRSTLSRGLMISALLHGGLVIGALALRRPAPPPEPPAIAIDLVEPVAPPEVPPPPETPPPPAPFVRAALRIAQAKPAPAPAPAPTPTPAAALTAPETPPDPTPDPTPVTVAAGPPAASITTGGVVGAPAGPVGAPGGTGHGPALVAPPLTEAQRRQAIDRYLQEILRTRIRDAFRYPAAARELELSGAVVVRATLDRSGRLLGVRLNCRCPHGILCDDALRTIRAAAPFPPLPAELGETLPIDVPLTYAFDGAP